MTDTTFDTLAASKVLQKSGFAPEQADAIASLQKAAIDNIVEVKELATKKDLADLETRLVKHMFNMLLAFAGAIGAFFAIAAFFLKS